MWCLETAVSWDVPTWLAPGSERACGWWVNLAGGEPEKGSVLPWRPISAASGRGPSQSGSCCPGDPETCRFPLKAEGWITAYPVGQRFPEIPFLKNSSFGSLIIKINSPHQFKFTFKSFSEPAISDDIGHFSSIFLCLFYFWVKKVRRIIGVLQLLFSEIL